MSQTNQILTHLKSKKTITPLQALSRFDCLRLAARISDLRMMGYKIATEIIESNGKRFAKYKLIS